MFTIAHLADLHLGYSSGRKKINENGYNVRENDGYVAYSEVINQIIKEKVDSVLIAGDVFHTPRPKNHTILIAQEGLRKLAENDIKVYLLAGNHDATDIRSEVPSSKLLHEPGSGIYSFSDPYVVKEIGPGIYVHFVSHHAFLDQEETMSNIKLKEDAVNILASHGSCYDTNIGVVLKSPNEPREIVIPQSIMDMNWDYTLLGHIHERGWVSSKSYTEDTSGRKQFYNGSLLRRGFADKSSPTGRGWTKWTVKKDKQMECEMFSVPEREQLDLTPIDVKDKNIREVEIEIIEQLQAVDEHLENKFGEVNLTNTPIIRQTITGVNSSTRLSLNLKAFSEYTSRYLIHSFKIIADSEDVDMSDVTTIEALKNNDIVKVFKEWNQENEDLFQFEEEVKNKVSKTAGDYLKESRDELLIED